MRKVSRSGSRCRLEGGELRTDSEVAPHFYFVPLAEELEVRVEHCTEDGRLCQVACGPVAGGTGRIRTFEGRRGPQEVPGNVGSRREDGLREPVPGHARAVQRGAASVRLGAPGARGDAARRVHSRSLQRVEKRITQRRRRRAQHRQALHGIEVHAEPQQRPGMVSRLGVAVREVRAGRVRAAGELPHAFLHDALSCGGRVVRTLERGPGGFALLLEDCGLARGQQGWRDDAA